MGEEAVPGAAAAAAAAAAERPEEAPTAASSRWRSEDVVADKSFSDLGLPTQLVAALSLCGYDRPSPVQQAAIPLGRLGSDLIVQAKSGTGKTVVFASILMERIKADVAHVQAVVVAPTREVAIQSEQVISRLAAALSDPPAIASAVFVGGLPVVQDEKRLRRLLHVAVGTPGRLLALLSSGSLKCDRVACLVLDEADQLLAESFYLDVTSIYDQLPRKKQVMAFSATYTPELLADLEPLTKRAHKVMLCEETVSLRGVRQFYQLLDAPGEGGVVVAAAASEAEEGPPSKALFERKVAALLRLLGGCSFHQASVFCNDKPQAEWLALRLGAAGFPSRYLGANLEQEERQRVMADLKAFKLRVIVSTDVLARGVDLDRINLVVNMDLPRDAATYVHRVGRTGRFGTRGVAVCLVTAAELQQLRAYVAEAAAGEVEPLPEGQLPPDLYAYELSTQWEQQALQALQQQSGAAAAAAAAADAHENGGSAPHADGAGAGAGADGAPAVAVVSVEQLPPAPPSKAEARALAAAAAAAGGGKKGGKGKRAEENGAAPGHLHGGSGGGGEGGAYTEEERLAAWQAYYASMAASPGGAYGWWPADAAQQWGPWGHQQQQQQHQEAWSDQQQQQQWWWWWWWQQQQGGDSAPAPSSSEQAADGGAVWSRGAGGGGGAANGPSAAPATAAEEEGDDDEEEEGEEEEEEGEESSGLLPESDGELDDHAMRLLSGLQVLDGAASVPPAAVATAAPAPAAPPKASPSRPSATATTPAQAGARQAQQQQRQQQGGAGTSGPSAGPSAPPSSSARAQAQQAPPWGQTGQAGSWWGGPDAWSAGWWGGGGGPAAPQWPHASAGGSYAHHHPHGAPPPPPAHAHPHPPPHAWGPPHPHHHPSHGHWWHAPPPPPSPYGGWEGGGPHPHAPPSRHQGWEGGGAAGLCGRCRTLASYRSQYAEWLERYTAWYRAYCEWHSSAQQRQAAAT